jgi:hypothetical protein
MTNLKLYVTEEDYLTFAGPDWPSYQDYLAGSRGIKPKIQEEISQFTQQHLEAGIKFPINTATACQSKWTKRIMVAYSCQPNYYQYDHKNHARVD